MRCVVTYCPSGHRSRSSTSTVPPPSWIRRVAHGSGTHAPSMSPALKESSVAPFSCGLIETSPPPDSSADKPLSCSQARSATSWVLPSAGVAIVVPARSAGDVISGFTTRNAPPDVAPDTMRSASPSDLAKPLIAGFGPMYVASMASANRASTASPPALNVDVSSVTSSPSASARMPLSTPTSAVAWVTFGKYPRRNVTCSPGAGSSSVGAAESAGAAASAAGDASASSSPQPAASTSTAARPTTVDLASLMGTSGG